MAGKKSGRGIVLNRDVLQKARKNKLNMTQEDLAMAVGIDVRMIQRAEAEVPIDPVYADKIAGILGVEVLKLVKKDARTTADAASKQGNPQRAKAPDDTTIAHFPEKLLSAIVFDGSHMPPIRALAMKQLSEQAMFLDMEDGYKEDDVTVTTGSLIVTVPLSRRDTASLVNAFIAGELEQFKVVSINVATDFARKAETVPIIPDDTTTPLPAGPSRPNEPP